MLEEISEEREISCIQNFRSFSSKNFTRRKHFRVELNFAADCEKVQFVNLRAAHREDLLLNAIQRGIESQRGEAELLEATARNTSDAFFVRARSQCATVRCKV